MSATLRVEDFTQNKNLFKQIPPVINVESRQYPVSVHFNRHTYEDYIAEAYRKVCKIHRRLPDGGILVFLTGQQEVNLLCDRLRRTFPASSSQKTDSKRSSTDDRDAKKNNKKRKDEPTDASKFVQESINLDRCVILINMVKS